MLAPIDISIRKSAVLGGHDQRYRYELRRVWDDGLPLLVVCMLNPSRADHQVNDPTILALIHFARLWGYGGILVVNLWAYRASSPAEMMAASEPFGPENGHHIEQAMLYARANGGRGRYRVPPSAAMTSIFSRSWSRCFWPKCLRSRMFRLSNA